MKKNKGIIGLGLVLAIVLGVVVVGGGAYYLGKSKGENKEINNQDENLQPLNQDQEVVENNKKVNAQSKLTIYNSKTYGYAIGYSGIDSKNVYITGDGKNINLFPNQSNMDTIDIVDLATFLPSPDSIYKGTVTFGNNQYKKFKNSTIPRITTYLISGLKNNKSILISVENDLDTPNYLDLSSLRIEPINSSEESATEVFTKQPGAIKSIEYEGAELLVDLLTYNPNWMSGENEFFLNQNSKIRRLNVNNATVIKNCKSQSPDYFSSFENNLPSFVSYVQDKIIKAKTNPGIVGSFGYTAYFDINGTNITAIYEQCLP